MTLTLPREAVAIVFRLQQAGYSAEVVGGAIRDVLLGRSTNDWDFTTNATPEKIQELFPENFYTNTFGTVGVSREHLFSLFGWDASQLSDEEKHEIFEITTYRSESAYSDFRRPDAVTWGKTLEEDLSRRDLTINALAFRPKNLPIDLSSTNVTVEGVLIDPYNGRRDLMEKHIVTVGDASERFQEDALRMLRAVRLAAQLEFSLDPLVVVALQQHAELITHVSWERIRDEFLKIVVTSYVEQAITLLAATGLLQYILPELLETRNIEQRGHHEYDVWTHTLRACATCPSTDPIVKFATLLHDIAKPQTQSPIPESNGEFSFYNHEVVGARVARDVARRFRLSKDDIQRVFTLVRWHMFHYQTGMTDAAIRRFIRRVGVENIEDMMAVREGDRLGSGSKRTSWRLEEMKERIYEQLHQPMQVKDIAVKGEDVMATLAIPPSRKVGEVLQALFEEVLEDPSKNTREYLLERMKYYAAE